jgi:hypothetical protein
MAAVAVSAVCAWGSSAGGRGVQCVWRGVTMRAGEQGGKGAKEQMSKSQISKKEIEGQLHRLCGQAGRRSVSGLLRG